VAAGLLGVGGFVAWWTLLATPRTSESQTKVGFVSAVVGKWKCPEHGDVLLTVGDELPAGGRLVPQDAQSGDEIRIYFRDAHEEQFRSAQDLPPQTASIMPIRLWTAMQEQYSGNVRHESLLSRDMPLKIAPLDGLARLEGSKLDLTDVFARMPEGAYRLLVWSVAPGDQPPYLPGESPEPPVEVEFSWTSEKPQPAATDKLRPGLFRIEISDCEQDSLRNAQCHILVADAARFESLQRLYQSALSDEVRGRLGDGGMSAMLLRRSALEVLAQWPGE